MADIRAKMDTYKEGQGSLARLSVWVLLILTVFLACVELYTWIQSQNDKPVLFDLELTRKLPFFGVPMSWKFLLCVALFGAFLWLSKRYMTKRSTVDTLVEVELELKKVSWPTKDESLNATWVVIFVTLLITFLLFTFDIVLRYIFGLIF